MMKIDWKKVQDSGWIMKDGKNVKILSIDGGGIRGIFAAKYLSMIEKDLGRNIYEYFDLIVGTSTGGIIALALSIGINAKKIEKLYVKNGNKIFKPKNGLLSKVEKLNKKLGILCMALSCKYDNKELKQLLDDIFDDVKIDEAKTLLCITAVEHSKAKPKVYKTPHNKGLFIDKDKKMTDIALATAAAPTYLPAHKIEDYDCLLDGGLWANNPSLVGIAEAVKNGIPLDKISVLSIGTGVNLYDVDNKKAQKGGLLSWKGNLLDVIFNVQSESAYFTSKYLIGDSLTRINFTPTRQLSLDSIKESDIKFMLKEASEKFADSYKDCENVYYKFFNR